MTEHKGPFEDPAERFLVEKFAPARSTDAVCPDPGLLAGFAEGRLLDEERRGVEEHVAECERCRAMAADIAGTAPAVESARPSSTAPAAVLANPPSRWRLPAVAAAAAVVAALLLWRGGDAPRKVPQGTEAVLAAAASDLAGKQPALFGGFKPLSQEERRARGSRERGSLVALYPAGLVIDPRPRIRWEPAPGVDEYEVALLSKDGVALWSAKTSEASLDYPADEPALEPGRTYIWEVSTKGSPIADDTAERTFTVATTRKRDQFRDAWRAIEINAPKRVIDLLKAHYAIREKVYDRAEQAARAFVKKNPKDKVGRETLFQVLELLDSSEAGDVLEGGG